MKLMTDKGSPTTKPLIILFIAISIFSILAGILYYHFQKENLLNKKETELTAILYLKIRQISQWRYERIGDGKFLNESNLLAEKFSEYIHGNKSKEKDLRHFLKSLTLNYDYKSANIIENSGRIRLAFPVNDTIMDAQVRSLITGLNKNNQIKLTDLHKSDEVDYVHLDLIIPLLEIKSNDTLVLGMLTLRIDPQKVLYPLIQSWPTPSKSAETLLLRRDGDEIVYLNELRYLKNTAFILKKSLTSEYLPAALAVRGITSTIDGVDYRQVHVVAAMNKVPGTLWYMVAKMDRKEILTELVSQMKMIAIIILLLIITSGLFLAFLIRSQRVAFYREKYKTELNRLALVKHFDYILKYANDIIILIDSELNIVEANDHALEFYQYTRDEFIGLKAENLRAPETKFLLADTLQMLEKIGYSTFETVHIRKDRTTFPIELSSRVVMIEGRKYYQTIGRDITDRKKASAELDNSISLLKATLESTEDGLLVVDSSGKIVQVNQKFLEMWRIPDEVLATGEDNEALEYVCYQLINPDTFLENVKHLYSNPEATSFDTLEFKDGRYFERYSQPQKINGRSVGRVWSFRDITKKKRAETELITSKEKAEESDRLKTAFLHNVSHEIRTPMNAIIGFSSLLNEHGLTDTDRRQYVEVINQSGGQLLSIINDIVDIANVESGQAKVNETEFNLNSALKRLCEQFSISGQQNKDTIQLSTALPDDVCDIVTDNTKLIQILSNLINNAIKFTKNGEVEFGYCSKNEFLEFFVKDTGIGISPEYHNRIFDRFYQVDNAVSRQFTGTGLGLSICKGYVELLGGEINVESELEKGTIFRFTIPFKKTMSI